MPSPTVQPDPHLAALLRRSYHESAEAGELDVDKFYTLVAQHGYSLEQAVNFVHYLEEQGIAKDTSRIWRPGQNIRNADSRKTIELYLDKLDEKQGLKKSTTS